MSTFKPKKDDYVECISESFTKQGVMETLSARLNTIEPGFVEIELSITKSCPNSTDLFTLERFKNGVWTTCANMQQKMKRVVGRDGVAG